MSYSACGLPLLPMEAFCVVCRFLHECRYLPVCISWQNQGLRNCTEAMWSWCRAQDAPVDILEQVCPTSKGLGVPCCISHRPWATHHAGHTLFGLHGILAMQALLAPFFHCHMGSASSAIPLCHSGSGLTGILFSDFVLVQKHTPCLGSLVKIQFEFLKCVDEGVFLE